MPHELPPLPNNLSKLSKDELKVLIEEKYAATKPINDAMVDASFQILEITKEIYRRTIDLALPGVAIKRVRRVTSIGCNVSYTKGIPEILKRVAAFKQEGIEIISVDFDETLNEYHFYALPTEKTP